MTEGLFNIHMDRPLNLYKWPGISGKIEVSVEIKSPGDVFFDVFGTKKADMH